MKKDSRHLKGWTARRRLDLPGRLGGRWSAGKWHVGRQSSAKLTGSWCWGQRRRLSSGSG
jgi:hypothetical protein